MLVARLRSSVATRALAVLAAAAGLTAATAGASQAATATTSPEVVVASGGSQVITVPADVTGATAVTLDVTTRYAWRDTAVTVCPGSTSQAACLASPASLTAVNAATTRQVTVPLTAADAGTVRIASASAAVRVTIAATDVQRPATAASTTPGPGTVGVPKGAVLRKHTGNLTVTTANSVVENLDVSGVIRIKAPNVTIRNTIVRGGPQTANTSLISNDLGKFPFTVEDSTLVASDASPYINGIIGGSFTVVRTEIANVIDSVHIVNGNVTVKDSWFHSNLVYMNDPNHKGGPSHADNIQIQSGNRIHVLNNRIEGAYSSVLQTTQDRGAVSDILVQGNFLGGGGCQINIAFGQYGPLQGVVVKDNTFNTDSRIARCAIIAPKSFHTALTNTGNTYVDGAAVKISNGG